jgi:pimeloyl-ACP methyl ester carboxylesterase
MSETIDDAKALSILTGDEIDDLEKEVRFYRTRHDAKIAYHDYGDTKGEPLFFYHGTGSHVHGMLLHKPGLKYGFRIIAPDRPGVAQSDFLSDWTVLEYARIVADLADHLGISSFGAIGISGGGPTLMATAFLVPDRLRCVIDLACAMPLYSNPQASEHLGAMDRLYARMGTTLPLALFEVPFSLLGVMEKIMKSPKSFAKMFDSSLCPADKDLFSIPEFQYLFMRDFQELFRHGAKGPAYDAQTVYKGWGFNLSDIATHIEVFQGSEDIFVPQRFSEYLASMARDVRLNLIEGQGHFYHLAYGYDTLGKVKDLFYSEEDRSPTKEP